MGRIARPPADDQEASVYWEDKWDARGKRFKANEVSCAHRTEAFGTVFVVTNLENGKKIAARCRTAARSHAAGFSTSRSAPRARSAATACAASPCVAPATSRLRPYPFSFATEPILAVYRGGQPRIRSGRVTTRRYSQRGRCRAFPVHGELAPSGSTQPHAGLSRSLLSGPNAHHCRCKSMAAQAMPPLKQSSARYRGAITPVPSASAIPHRPSRSTTQAVAAIEQLTWRQISMSDRRFGAFFRSAVTQTSRP